MLRFGLPLLRYVLAVGIAVAPMMPTFALAKTSATKPITHAHHTSVRNDTNADYPTSPSGKHDHCNDHCCLACGVSLTQTGAIRIGGGDGRSPQVPIVSILHSDPLAPPLDRPPRTLS